MTSYMELRINGKRHKKMYDNNFSRQCSRPFSFLSDKGLPYMNNKYNNLIIVKIAYSVQIYGGILISNGQSTAII